MVEIINKKIGLESAASSVNSGKEALLHQDIQHAFVEMKQGENGLMEFAVAMGQIAETEGRVSQALADSGTTGSGASGTRTQAKKQIIQQKIARVQAMSQSQLQSGLRHELNQEITHLFHKARKLERSFWNPFSAYEMNKVISQIRKMKEQLAELARYTLEKLRELYITLVLRLKVVKV